MLSLVAPPSSSVLTLSGAKGYMREDMDYQDAVVNDIIMAATAYFDGPDGILGRCLVNQTWDYSMDVFCPKVYLPLAPVQSLVSVTYYDDENVEQTLEAGLYNLIAHGTNPYLKIADGESLPSTYARDDAVTIRAIYGYGDAADVPEDIKLAMRLFVNSLEQMRTTDSDKPTKANYLGVEALTAKYRRVWK